MECECTEKGKFWWDSDIEYFIFTLPLSFILNKDETYELESVNIEQIIINEERDVPFSRKTEIYPLSYLENDAIKPISRQPILIAPEGASNRDDLCIRFECKPQQRFLKEGEKNAGKIFYNIKIRNSSKISFYIDFYFYKTTQTVCYSDPVPTDSKTILLFNIALITLAIIGVSVWNLKINSNSYSPIIDPSLITNGLIFLCGVFGLPILTISWKLINFSTLRSFLTLPQLYISPSMVKVFRTKFATLFIAITYLFLLISVFILWGFKIPNSESIWENDTILIDQNGNIVNSERIQRNFISNDTNKILIVLEGTKIEKERIEQCCLGTVSDSSTSISVFEIPIMPRLEIEYRDFKAYFSNTLKNHLVSNHCGEKYDDNENKYFIEFSAENDLNENRCLNIIKNEIINTIKYPQNKAESTLFRISSNLKKDEFFIQNKRFIEKSKINEKIDSVWVPNFSPENAWSYLFDDFFSSENMLNKLEIDFTIERLSEKSYMDLYESYYKKLLKNNGVNNAVQLLVTMYYINEIFFKASKNRELSWPNITKIVEDVSNFYPKRKEDVEKGGKYILRAYLRFLLSIQAKCNEVASIEKICQIIEELLAETGYDYFKIYLEECIYTDTLFGVNGHQVAVCKRRKVLQKELSKHKTIRSFSVDMTKLIEQMKSEGKEKEMIFLMNLKKDIAPICQ